MEVHSGRLAALRELRSRMSWITRGGGPGAALTRAQRAVSMGIPPGTAIVRGVELAGLVKWAGLGLPDCLAGAGRPSWLLLDGALRRLRRGSRASPVRRRRPQPGLRGVRSGSPGGEGVRRRPYSWG